MRFTSYIESEHWTDGDLCGRIAVHAEVMADGVDGLLLFYKAQVVDLGELHPDDQAKVNLLLTGWMENYHEFQISYAEYLDDQEHTTDDMEDIA